MSHDQSAQPVRPEMVNGIPAPVLSLLVEAKKTPSKYEDAGRELARLIAEMPPPFVTPQEWAQRLADLCCISETARRLGIHDWLRTNAPRVFSRVPSRYAARFVKGFGDAVESGDMPTPPTTPTAFPPL